MCPAFDQLEELEPDQGRYLARTVSAVETVKVSRLLSCHNLMRSLMSAVCQFSDAKLSPEHWEEIAREIKQPHNKLR